MKIEQRINILEKRIQPDKPKFPKTKLERQKRLHELLQIYLESLTRTERIQLYDDVVYGPVLTKAETIRDRIVLHYQFNKKEVLEILE